MWYGKEWVSKSYIDLIYRDLNSRQGDCFWPVRRAVFGVIIFIFFYYTGYYL